MTSEEITIEIRLKVPRRRKTNKVEDKFYTKGGEKRSSVMRRLEAQAANLAKRNGRVVTKPWEKGGKVVDIDPVPPPFTRAAVRESHYGDGTGQRIGNTVPDLKLRRKRRRRKNQISKASRRANR